MLSPTASASAQTDRTIATKGSPLSRSRSKLGLFDLLRAARLQWLQELGIGFYNVTANPYGPEYFDHYAVLADTDIGRKLNAARLAMLARYWHGDGVVDIGIGAGTFCESRPGTMGYDVNPVGVSWLRQRGLYLDPYDTTVDVACLWDCLEHVHNPAPLLANVRKFVLVSIPIFRDVAHVLASKHFKPAEHCWFFEERGLLTFMSALGWTCVEMNDAETRIGRQDIKSYAFRRV